MKYILFLYMVATLAATACRPESKAKSGEDKTAVDYTIEPGRRVGAITAATTAEELQQLYGAENVRRDTIWLMEGDFDMGTKVFPGTDNELEIIWSEQGTPSLIRLTKPGSEWEAPNGLKAGISLQELESLNMRPFQFFGFEWDFGGAVTDWKGGRMPPSVMVTLTPGNTDLLSDNYMGEVLLTSDDPELKSFGITVGVLTITFD
ncbi:MAG: hypothetical protein KF852_18615 [Saprospiraceae bacterium]|nr:hypothetical protein [Saprospiraceae bacterium]